MFHFSHRILFSVSLSFIVIFLLSSLAIANDWELVKPAAGKKITLKIDGKTRNYWRIDRKEPVIINVTGPGQLKIITRMVLPNEKQEDVYSFVLYIDGKRQPLIARATQYSKSVSNAKFKDQRLGESRSVFYKVPAGDHEYKLTLSKDFKEKIYARPFVANGSEKKTNYIAYLPRFFPEEVRISVKEHEYIYYRTNKDKPIELEVIGPTKVKCISRLEYDDSMRGKQNYRIQVTEGDKVIQTDFFNSEISSIASYIDRSDMVIGKGEVFYIEVPEGKHKYSIFTPDPDTSIIFRFYLPEKDLGNIAAQGSSYVQR